MFCGTKYHTGRSNSSFDTALGESISTGLNNLAAEYDLSFQFGTAPQDFYLSRSVSALYALRTGF